MCCIINEIVGISMKQKSLLSIKDILKKSRVMLAPMAGTTDFGYRELVREMSKGLIFTEMISAKALVYGDKKTRTLLRFNDNQRPVGVQLFGSEPDFMAKAAKIVEEEFYPNVIDINMGCPVPKIVNNCEGSALMRNPTLAAEIVAAMSEAVEIPITVKMRAGFNDRELNAPLLAQRVVEAGAKMVSVHGRTREQYYNGKADWGIIKQVKEAVRVPVVGNGDIFTPYDAVKMFNETNCDAVMIARGAQGNPWLFEQVESYLKTGEFNKPSTLDKLSTMKKHLKLAVEDKGEYTGVREMRSHLAWYVKGMPRSASFRQRLFQETCYDEVCKMLDQFVLNLQSNDDDN